MSELLKKGINRLEWARAHMPVMKEVEKSIKDNGHLEGKRIGMALHVEAKTGILALSLQNAGAKVRLASCNPLSTDDSVSIALNEEYGLDTYAKKGESNDGYYQNLENVLALKPEITIDDGGDLVFMIHTKYPEMIPNILGGNEETTTGIIRLKAMEKEGALKYPVFAVNNAQMKYLFDNRYGTGQSTFDGILNATNLVIAGKKFVVGGYGWCGRGIAMRAKGMGANVVVTEVDPIKAIEAKMDGFEVMPMGEAAEIADFIVSVTGCKDIVRKEHLEVMKDGCVLANSGHFDNEISKEGLTSYSTEVKQVREFVDRYTLRNGKKVYLLADGRLVNLAAGQGHPAEIMDMSFAIQALCTERIAMDGKNMEAKVYDVPSDMDERVARIKLNSMGVKLDKLTDVQIRYLNEWKEGT